MPDFFNPADTLPLGMPSSPADTLPVDMLSVLRENARQLIAARDAIDDCFSPAWAAAHLEAVAACEHATAEMNRLAANPLTRYGSWRTPGDVELMALGYL